MRTIKIKSYKDFQRSIGQGSEGDVYSYKDKYAIKVFSTFDWKHSSYLSLEKLDQKMKKIEVLMKLKDESATFPLGFVEMPDDDKAFYMPLIKKPGMFLPQDGLSDYEFYEYSDKLETILIKTSYALERLHNLGIALGDIKRSNILLRDGTEPVFVDVDNSAYQDFSFDLVPDRADTFHRIYKGNKNNLIDNDRLVFALMVLEFKTHDNRFCFTKSAREIGEALKKLKTNKEAKEVLKCIFSDAENKPYIGPVLKKIR